MTVTYIVNATITDPNRFATIAGQCQTATKTASGCLAYDWYVNGNQAIIYEKYVDDDAFLAHMDVVGDLLPTLMEACNVTNFQILGNISADVATVFEDFPTTNYSTLLTTITA